MKPVPIKLFSDAIIPRIHISRITSCTVESDRAVRRPFTLGVDPAALSGRIIVCVSSPILGVFHARLYLGDGRIGEAKGFYAMSALIGCSDLKLIARGAQLVQRGLHMRLARRGLASKESGR